MLMNRLIVLLLSVVTFVSLCDALRCSCGNHPPCPTRPECEEYGLQLCGCCEVCKLGFGEVCNSRNAPCKTGLTCLAADGQTYNDRPQWWQSQVKGVCVKSPICPGISNPDSTP